MMKPPFKASDGAVMHCGLICALCGLLSCINMTLK